MLRFPLLTLLIAMSQFPSAGETTAPKAEDFQLTLGGVRFDPLQGPAPLPAGWRADDLRESDAETLQLIQFKGPIQEKWLSRIRAAGLDVVQYIHPYTYVVWGKPSHARASTGFAFVRWTGPFEPGFRVLPAWRDAEAAEVDTVILLYGGVDSGSAIADLAALGGRDLQVGTLGRFLAVTLRLPAASYRQAADIAAIYTIQPRIEDGGDRGEMSDQVCANNFDMAMQIFPGYKTWLTTIGLDGSDVIVASVDSGADNDHPDLVNRFLPCVGANCGGSLEGQHGTHTAAIVAGDAASGTTDGNGFLRALGVAPGASLIEQYYPGNYLGPRGIGALIQGSFLNGATLSSNSWGPSAQSLGYEVRALEVDLGVRDADPDSPGNQPLSYILAIDNGNGGVSSQGTPDEAKNLFSVGSTWIQESNLAQRTDFNSISNNSAHGPCLDGRFLPHIVAPGKFVDSARIGSYGAMSGTSMACPHVAGAVALFVEKYRMYPLNPGGDDPSPALVKSAFMPVAIDLAGNTDANGGILGHRFDSKQGYGRMNLEAVVDPDVSVVYFDNPQILEQTSDEWLRPIRVANPLKPVKIMLAWTDAPGHGLGGSTPAWNNDLDLVVELNADTYMGNQLGPSGWSTPSMGSDTMNNTEGILLELPGDVTFTMRVVAANLNSDGIPNQGDAIDQDFAVTCYNCAQDPGFVLISADDEKAICAGEDAVYAIDVISIAGFTDPVTLTLEGLPAGAMANFAPNPATPGSFSTLTISNTAPVASGLYPLMVNGTSGAHTGATELGLDVDAAEPGVPTLTTPADGSKGQLLATHFTWQALPQASTYRFELAADAAFMDILQDLILDTNDLESGFLLEYGTTYYWRVTPANNCGDGPVSPTSSFTTVTTADVLLVDDDDNSPDVREAYTQALDFWGITYEIWDTANSTAEPQAADMAGFQSIIWFSGDATDSVSRRSGPTLAGETALTAYLDGGGCLVISAQDYLFDVGGEENRPNMFMTNVLGVGTTELFVAQTVVTGVDGPFAGLGPYALAFPFTNNSDLIGPDENALTAFSGDQGSAAVLNDTGTYKSVYMGFPFEALNNSARLDTMLAFLNLCDITPEGVCLNETNFLAKLPLWPHQETTKTLIQCINGIL